MGQITGKWLAAKTKMEMIDLIDESVREGVSCRRSCELLMIHRSRIFRWQQACCSDKSLENGTPGPEQALHRLLPEERKTMVALARQEDLADLSHRELTVTAWDKGLVYFSFSTTYRVLKSAGLMGMRGKDRRHNGSAMAPIRKDLTGPNQRWCWDISYVPWYNNEHYHSGIDYVTSHQAHIGQRAAIVEERQRKMQKQRLRRKEVNRNNMGLTEPKEKIINNPGQEALCSVIP